MHARNKKTGAAIIAIVDQLLGNTGVTENGFSLDEHGHVMMDYDDSGTDIAWDSCEAYKTEGGCLFLDENKENVHERDVELFEPETGRVQQPTVDHVKADMKTLQEFSELVERLTLKVTDRDDVTRMLSQIEEDITA